MKRVGTKNTEETKKHKQVGCGGEEEEYLCLAYKKNRWVSFGHGASSAKEVVGTWKSVVRFCGERKVRPEILFYKALQWPNK